MSILDEILESLKRVSKVQNTKVEGEFRAGSSIIEGVDLKEIEERIEGVLSRHAKEGEEIITKIEKGEILDGGRAYFRILGGYVIEFYDYENTTSVFIRNYHISDGDREWVAVYVDQNPNTPWWGREERK